VFFAIVVFKQEKDVYEIFQDRYSAQQKLLQQFKQISKNLTKKEEEAYYFDVISRNLEITQEETEFLRLKNEAEKEGFTLVTNKQGTLRRKEADSDAEQITSRKKKKQVFKPDFYRFQITNLQLQNAIYQNFDEALLTEGDLLRLKKKQLKQAFQQDIQKLEIAKEKKLKI